MKLSGTASEQLPRHMMWLAASSSDQAGVWLAPFSTANGCMSAIACASARAATSSIGPPLPSKNFTSILRP